MTVQHLVRRFRFRSRRPAGARDAGFTLIEISVTVLLLGILSTVTAASVMALTRGSERADNIAAVATEGQRAFLRLDKQVRYASSINRPGLVGTDWYVEFLDTASGAQTCHQWRLRDTMDDLQHRSWTVNPDGSLATGSTTAWITDATSVVNTGAAQAPFGFAPADATYEQQSLSFRLLMRTTSPQAAAIETRTRFFARNSSVRSPTNPDTGQVCNHMGRS